MGQIPIPGGKTVQNTADYIKAFVAGAALTTAAGTFAAVSKNRTSMTQYRNLQFPTDLINDTAGRNYYMTLQFQSYERRAITDRAFVRATDGIRLPIPNNLVDTTQVSYSDQALGPAGGAAIEAADEIKKSGGSAGSIGQGTLDILNGLAQGGAAQAAPLTTKVLSQTFGVAQNPMLTVLFESPTFKEHQFSWKLSPNNQQESNTIRDIINTFKSHMLPGLTDAPGGSLLSYPDIVNITIYPNDEYLYKFKPCVITSMSINFAPGNTPSFFNTKAPTEVQITINLKETEYWLQQDIDLSTYQTQGINPGGHV
jgi:hypothetical protein